MWGGGVIKPRRKSRASTAALDITAKDANAASRRFIELIGGSISVVLVIKRWFRKLSPEAYPRTTEFWTGDMAKQVLNIATKKADQYETDLPF